MHKSCYSYYPYMVLYISMHRMEDMNLNGYASIYSYHNPYLYIDISPQIKNNN